MKRGRVIGFKVMPCRVCGAKTRYADLSEMPLLCATCKPICKHPERVRLVLVPCGTEWCGWCGFALTLEQRIADLTQENEDLRRQLAQSE